jgi:hypothetical protein
MNCYWCDAELIWGGDHDTEDNTEYSVITNLTCLKCNSYVEIYKRRDAYD